MKDMKITFSPHTVDPRFVDTVLTAAAEAQRNMAMAMLEAQIQMLRATLAAQLTFAQSVWQASLPPPP